MNRVVETFGRLRSEGRRGLAPFLCAGRPGLDRLPELLQGVEEAGASIVEIGVPFSDPIADGPVIAAAMHRALLEGVTPAKILDALEKARPRTSLALVAMVSVSIVHRAGAEAFARRAAAAGFDGLIVPDAPVDESGPIRAAADAAGLTLSLLVAPTTPPDRARRIVEACTGFVYLIARAGITGERDRAPEIEARVRAIRAVSDLPIACGFGISSAAQVRDVVRHADAAIVGSALVRRIEAAIESHADPVQIARAFVADLATGLPSAGP